MCKLTLLGRLDLGLNDTGVALSQVAGAEATDKVDKLVAFRVLETMVSVRKHQQGSTYCQIGTLAGLKVKRQRVDAADAVLLSHVKQLSASISHLEGALGGHVLSARHDDRAE